MLKSMTAYGRATLISSIGRLSVELQSVNRKHLEISTYLPKEFLRYDPDIKKWIAAAVGRGLVNVKLHVVFDRESPLVVTPNIPLANQIKQAWEKIGQHLGMILDDRGLIGVLGRQGDLLLYDDEIQDEAGYKAALKEVINQALHHFLEMKKREGEALYQDISTRFARLAEWIKLIAAKAPGATDRYRQRLKERIDEVMGMSKGGNVESEERLMREVCIYAEKIDIAEELTRFDSHLSQVRQLMHSDDSQGIGKTLEFLVQELNRETNTISSKSSDVDVTRTVIDIKSELERIREQIQNIE